MANFTKQAIKAAFLELLDEKPLNKISVRDIVEQVLRARGDWARDSQGVTPSSLAASR